MSWNKRYPTCHRRALSGVLVSNGFGLGQQGLLCLFVVQHRDLVGGGLLGVQLFLPARLGGL